ncbi:MAG: glycosyltransferase family 2 protein [Flavobacteriaceae bacterium]|nr:MAG: glycosyltransferase family 2 protein [Flavobacteriaceae bacterium]
MEDHLVSVVIPHYNRPDKLERCIQSVQEQSYANYEIIVVDDCSTNGPKNQHKDVQYLSNKENSGPGRSRNLGMSKSKGDYIVFLDCDDYWDSEFLSEMVVALNENSQAVMAYANGLNIDTEKNETQQRRIKEFNRSNILPDILSKGRAWGTGGCLWNRKLIKGILYTEARTWEDYAFDVMVGTQNNKVVSVDKNLVFYDITGEDRLSQNQAENFIVEKNKSIGHISDALINSEYSKDKTVYKKIMVLVFNNLIKLVQLDIKDTNAIKNNLNAIKDWRSPLYANYIQIILKLPKRYVIGILLRTKRKINQGISFLSPLEGSSSETTEL